MEAPNSDVPKLPDMVMCGDHPSFTKTELNVKTDTKTDEKDKERVKEKSLSYAKITPSASRSVKSEREQQGERDERSESETGARVSSQHALRLSEARRRVRSLEVVHRPDVHVQANGNQALVRAALGSFRWPPYLLCVWVLVLVLAHALHCLANLLERALPALRKCSQFFRTWTEETWRGGMDVNQRVYPVGLALVTALLYALYYVLYAMYAVVLWSIEPLYVDVEDKTRSATDDVETKITNYDDDIKTNSWCKP